MTQDRLHPSAKTNGAPMAATHTPAKTHLYNPTRHTYRQTPANSRHQRRQNREFSCRRCSCVTCFWFTLIFLIALLLAAISAVALYSLYRPHHPVFSVTSVKISVFNLTTNPSDDSTRLTTRINVTLSARNPNKKIVFLYYPLYIAVFSDWVRLSNGSFSNFTNSPGSISVIHAAMGIINSEILDPGQVQSLKTDLRRKNGLPMEIVMETMVGVKMEKMKWKMKKIGIRVKCQGIHGMVPLSNGRNGNPAIVNTAKAKCKVYLRIKIWKWTF